MELCGLSLQCGVQQLASQTELSFTCTDPLNAYVWDYKVAGWLYRVTYLRFAFSVFSNCHDGGFNVSNSCTCKLIWHLNFCLEFGDRVRLCWIVLSACFRVGSVLMGVLGELYVDDMGFHHVWNNRIYVRGVDKNEYRYAEELIKYRPIYLPRFWYGSGFLGKTLEDVSCTRSLLRGLSSSYSIDKNTWLNVHSWLW
jgi:hypothetical protein